MIRRSGALIALLVVCVLLALALAPRFLGAAAPTHLSASLPTPTPVPTARAARAAALVVHHVPPRPVAPLPVASDVGVMRLAASPSVDAAVVNAVLRREGSSLAGEGEAIVAAGRRWGIDPAYLLAFVCYFDVPNALPLAAHNVGHIRAVGSQPAVQGYRAFGSWSAGIDAWYRLIATLYVGRWHLTTLDAIVAVYAPGSGRRDVEAELNALRATVEAVRGLSHV